MRTRVPFRNGRSAQSHELGRQDAEVRIVAHQQRPDRTPGEFEQRFQDVDVQRSGKRVDDPNRETKWRRDQPGRVEGPELRRAQDGIRSEAGLGQEETEPLRLATAFLGEWAHVVGGVPFEGIAGVGVAEQVQLDGGRAFHRLIIARPRRHAASECAGPRQGLRSSTSPVESRTTSSAMFVARSPIRSRSLAAKSKCAPVSTQAGSVRMRSSERSK